MVITCSNFSNYLAWGKAVAAKQRFLQRSPESTSCWTRGKTQLEQAPSGSEMSTEFQVWLWQMSSLEIYNKTKRQTLTHIIDWCPFVTIKRSWEQNQPTVCSGKKNPLGAWSFLVSIMKTEAKVSQAHLNITQFWMFFLIPSSSLPLDPDGNHATPAATQH